MADSFVRLDINIPLHTKEQLEIVGIRKKLSATNAVRRAFAITSAIDNLIPQGGEISITDADGVKHVITIH